MTKKIIHQLEDGRGRLVCDAVGCGHKETKAHPFGEHLIGMPCPKCGASLLTRKDYEGSVEIYKWIDWLNRWFGWLGCEEKDITKMEARAKLVSVRYTNGNLEVEKRNENLDR